MNGRNGLRWFGLRPSLLANQKIFHWAGMTATCGAGVAEHAMMERLVIDDLLHWARTYRVR